MRETKNESVCVKWLNGANVRRTRSQQTVPKEANYSMKEKKKKKKKGGGELNTQTLQMHVVFETTSQTNV